MLRAHFGSRSLGVINCEPWEFVARFDLVGRRLFCTWKSEIVLHLEEPNIHACLQA